MAKCYICKNKFTPIRSSLEKTCQEIDCRTQWAMQLPELKLVLIIPFENGY